MNLKLIKQLEDLKEEKNKISSQISDFIKNKKALLLEKTLEDFIVFFSERGFNINKYSNGATAIYGSLNVTINLSLPEETFFGAYSVIDLIVTGTQRKNYKVVINEFGYKPGIKSRVRILPNSEDDRMEMEIKDLQEEIKELEKRNKEIDKLQLAYRIYDKDEVQKNPYLKTADTKQFIYFKELLSSIFE